MSISLCYYNVYANLYDKAKLTALYYSLSGRVAISVSGIADKFNHTEKDVIRALKYWEKQQILDLDFDDNKTLVDRKSTRLNSSHNNQSRMPSSA